MNAKASYHSPVDLRCTKSGPRLKVWWIPRVPMTEFEVFVDSFVAAKVLLGPFGLAFVAALCVFIRWYEAKW